MSDIVERLQNSGNRQDNLNIIFQWVRQGVITKCKDFKEVVDYEYSNRKK